MGDLPLSLTYPVLVWDLFQSPKRPSLSPCVIRYRILELPGAVHQCLWPGWLGWQIPLAVSSGKVRFHTKREIGKETMRMSIVIKHNYQRANLPLLWNGHKSQFTSVLTKHAFPLISRLWKVAFDISHTCRLISLIPRNSVLRATDQILKQILPPTSNIFNTGTIIIVSNETDK